MKIGLLLPSILMSKRFNHRIFAPKPLFISLVDGLVERGHTVYVYTSSEIKTKGQLIGGDKILEQVSLPSVKVRYENENFTKEMFNKISYYEYEADLTMKAFLHAQALELDIMHSYHDFLAHYFASMVENLPTCYTLHDPLYAPDTIEGWRMDHFPNDSYVAISHHQAKLYMNRIRIKGMVYHGIDVKNYTFCQNAKDYLAFMGRFVPEKGIIDALWASKETSKKLHLATSENYFRTPFYKNKIAPLMDSKLITAAGFLHNLERMKWLGEAKALLMPSIFQEPFGMVMIEAMACGTPVIAYANGSVPEVVEDGVTGFIVPSENDSSMDNNYIIKKEGKEGLVEAIERIYDMNEVEYKKMRTEARRRIEEKFTFKNMVEGYEEVYKKLI